MTLWKLYYEDGSTFSDSDGSWLRAPALGVMALATADQYVGREIDSPRTPGSGDYYIWRRGTPKPWWVDYGGLIDHLLDVGSMVPSQSIVDIPVDHLFAVGVKLGRTASNEHFREMWPVIVADADETFGGLDGERIPPPHLGS